MRPKKNRKKVWDQKKLGLKKNLKKDIGSEKILSLENFLFENVFGSNKITGLKILGPKKISGPEIFFGS